LTKQVPRVSEGLYSMNRVSQAGRRRPRQRRTPGVSRQRRSRTGRRTRSRRPGAAGNLVGAYSGGIVLGFLDEADGLGPNHRVQGGQAAVAEFRFAFYVDVDGRNLQPMLGQKALEFRWGRGFVGIDYFHARIAGYAFEQGKFAVQIQFLVVLVEAVLGLAQEARDYCQFHVLSCLYRLCQAASFWLPPPLCLPDPCRTFQGSVDSCRSRQRYRPGPAGQRAG
jgi:hypothetical protein